MRSVETWDRYAGEIAADPERFLRQEMFAAADLLAEFFRTGDGRCRSLYIGEKVRQAADGRAGPDERERLLGEIAAKDTANLVATMRPLASAVGLAELESALRGIEAVVGAHAGASVRLLLIGDCLHQDVMSFLVEPCLRDGVGLEPVFIPARNVAEQRALIRAHAQRPFDLVAFSPFSYEFSPELGRYVSPRHAMESGRSIRLAAEESLAGACETVDLLAACFACPVLVHTTAGVRRHDGSLREVAACLLTRHARAAARSVVNRGLAAHVDRRSRAERGRVSLIDETPLLGRFGEMALGRELCRAGARRPAALGMHLAPAYHGVITAIARARPGDAPMGDCRGTAESVGVGPARAVVLRTLPGGAEAAEPAAMP
ncbi:MAG: hypothetical protein WD749_03175 [Phycisphaerales bacterium]